MGNVQKLKLLESFSFTCSSIFSLFLSMANKLLPPQNAKHISSNLILWHCNTLTLQYFDTAILWYFDTPILWHCNFLLGEHLIQAENQLEASPRPTKSPRVDFGYTKTAILKRKKNMKTSNANTLNTKKMNLSPPFPHQHKLAIDTDLFCIWVDGQKRWKR